MTIVPQSVSLLYSVGSFTGSALSDRLVISNKRVVDLSLSTVGVSPNSYGLLSMSTGRAGDVASELLRVRKDKSSGRDRLDFIMPTALR